jgi:hypothetical protein
LEAVAFSKACQRWLASMQRARCCACPAVSRRHAQHPRRTADRPRPDLFGQQLEQPALGQTKPSRTPARPKNLPNERNTIRPT